MNYHCFEIETSDAIAHLKFSRPDQLNSLCAEFWSELPEIVARLSDEGRTRVMVISSSGRHFTAGLDLGILGTGIVDDEGEVGRRRANFRLLIRQLQDSLTCLERARMPILAAVQGGCVGGGIDLITACDMRYCSEDAFFCIQEINVGITADVGTLQRLPKLVPEGIVRELAYTGRRMSAARAREVGLVNEVYPSQDAMLEAVMETAREIASRSPLAIWGSKEMLNYTRDHSVEDGLEHVAVWQTGMFQESDLREAFASREEKRDALFPDLLPVRRKL